MRPNNIGRIVTESWLWLPSQYQYVILDEWVLMPDHLHALIVLADGHVSGRPGRSTTVAVKRKPLGD